MEQRSERGNDPLLTRREFLKAMGVAGVGAVIAWFTSPTFREKVMSSDAYQIAREMFEGLGKKSEVVVKKAGEAWSAQQEEVLKVDKQLTKKK